MIVLTIKALALVLLLSRADAHTRGATSQSQRNLPSVASWNQIGQDINGEAATDQSGWALAIDEDGRRLAVASPQNDGGGADAGSVRVFEYQSSGWTLLGSSIKGPAGAGTGQAVTISGDGTTVAVGSFRLFPYTGSIRIYRYENSDWRLLKQIDGRAARDRFGGSVSLNYDGTRLAVGAAYHEGTGVSPGKTDIFEQNGDGTVWDLIGTIDGGTDGDRSGHAVALSSDGSTVVIGEIAADPASTLQDAGTTAVYKRTSSLAGWTRLGNDIPGVRAGDQSGYSVAISGNGMIVAIGSPMHSSQATQGGMARVFNYDATQGWVQLGSNIFPESPGQNTKFGYSVSLSFDGMILAVGEPNDAGTGKASIYYYSSNLDTWSRDISLSAGAATDKYGYSVALSGTGTRLAVGAYNADQAGADSGKTRVYEFKTSDWLLNVDSFDANFGTGAAPELTLIYKGIAPSVGSGRTFRVTMLLPSCILGAATSTAIKPVAATGAVPAAESFRLVSRLDVDMDTVRTSGFYSDVGVGVGNLGFCVKMEVLQGSEVVVERLADISVELDMSQDFVVKDFVSKDPTTGKTDIRHTTQFNYGFSHYFCDEFGVKITSEKSVPPGGEVSVCLKADPNEPVLVNNVKSVSFQNFMAPLLGVPLITSQGTTLADTTVKDCSGGVCRIAAITVPRLYEYVDSSGSVKDVTAGVTMDGTVTFAFPSRRLQDEGENLETTFSVKLDLAKPPDRAGSRSNGVSSYRPSWMASVVCAAIALCAFL